MHFGEYELSPSLISLSPLPSSHPEAFQRLLVRSSIRCYPDFNLLNIKRDFGVILDSKDLARIKRDMPRKYIQGQGKPSARESTGETALSFRPIRAKRADPLLQALASYHLKRSKTDAERKHWGMLTK